ncbi:uncharacterized protein OCT59_000068 [Rhizophagus irregularis]|uniref:uncharacterized protein n=1 Tax=Rhizophagus irregularis TaxID=588596 RepID=UPI003331539F|nr:hypothetical protein OCT59_000068 [Rhizophagus irregularis]
MISEVIPPIESSNYDNHDNNEDNESTTLFAENILGFNFKDCVRSLPLINTPIKLEVGTSFYSMTIAIHYIEQFTLQNNFAIFKHKSEKFLDGTCRKKVLKCNLGGRYTQKLSRPTSDKMTMKGSKKQGCSSLYQEFLKDFRAVQRSHCEKVFEQRSQNLVEKYAAEERYISTVLLNRKHTWSSFFLLQAQEAIENRLEFESINTRYSIWKTSTLQYTQSLIIQTFFSGIDSIMKKYLTQPIHDAHYKQMCQSVCYFMHQVSIAEALTLDDDSFKPIFDGEDSAETFAEIDEDRELDLQSLMAMVNIDDIIEIWKISRYNYPKTYQFVILLSTGEHLCTCFMLITHGIVCRHFFKVFVKSSKARFHLTLIPCRWYKDEYISLSEGYFNEKVIGNRNFNYSSTFEFTRKYTINDLSEEYSKQITRKQLKYGILMGEAKKAIQFAICDDDEELIKLIKEPNGVLIESNQVLDSLKHQPKGRPPGKRFKSSTELKSKSKSEATDGVASVVYVEEMNIIVALVLQSSHFMYNNKVIFNS